MQKPVCGHNERVTFQAQGESVGEGPWWQEDVDITGRRSSRQLSERQKILAGQAVEYRERKEPARHVIVVMPPGKRPPNKNE